MESRTKGEAMHKTRGLSHASSINLPELLSRVDNDRELLLDLLNIFKEEFPRHLQALHDAVALHDMNQTATVSHTLKGMLFESGGHQGGKGGGTTGATCARRSESTRSESLRSIRNGSARAIARDGNLHGRGVALRILVADDEALSRRLLERTLVRAGYEVTAVENGRLAVEQLTRPDGPRLALLDWVMPELDGPEFAGQCDGNKNRKSKLTFTWFC
jgi:hypothetical protein